MITFKITMKKTFLNYLLALLPLAANAEPVEVDEIWYELDDVDHTAVVVASGDEPYTGAIEIPTSIYYNKNYYIVKAIGESAFEECTELIGITIPEGIESIEQGAFFGCCWLTDIIIPNGVKKIGLGAFSECTRLTQVSIPSSVTFIDQYAFDKCPSLTRINSDILQPFDINENVFAIPDDYITDNSYDVYSMALLVVPDGTKETYKNKLGWTLFANIVEASDVGEGGKNGEVFKYGKLYYVIGANNTVAVNSAISEDAKYAGDIEIPEQVSFNYVTYKVTGISNSAFKGCTDLTSVFIPDGVTTISLNAFDGCSNLTSITIPSTITQINSNAFLGCSNLSSVYITDLAAWCNINFVNSNANPLSYANLFLNKKKIVDLEIPNDVTTISNSAFRGLKDILSVKSPNTVISIGKDAFRDCSSLTSIFSGIENPFGIDKDVFTSSDKDIYATALLIVPVDKRSDYQNADGWGQFTYIIEEGQGGNVGQVFMEDGISYKIGENYTVSLVSGNKEQSGHVVIPSNVEFNGKTYSVTSIGNGAFGNCTGMSSIMIPSCIKAIGTDAFEETDNLTAVKISDIASWFNISFANHYSNPLFHAHHLYVEEQEVTDLVIPNNVLTIGDYAFYRCSGLKSITIHESVTSIGINAFNGCSGLTLILSLSTTPPTCQEGQLISADEENCVVLVPKGSLKAYQDAPGWKDFKDIKELYDGDVNFDGKLDKADVNVLVAYLMGKNPEDFHESQANLSGDGKINVADVVKLINLISGYGFSIDKQIDEEDVDGKTVISAISCTLYNERDEEIQLTKCELYFNQKRVSYKEFSGTSGNLAPGKSKTCDFDDLSKRGSTNGFAIYWYYTSNGEDYIFRYNLTD